MKLTHEIIHSAGSYGGDGFNKDQSNGQYMTEQTQKEINDSKLTPSQAIEILKRMQPDTGPICFDIADVIRDLVKQAESNVKMRSDMLAAPENQDPV